MAEVTLEAVAKRFGAVTAVADLSFTVKDGEFFVLLGPTGAGKTTTLRLVAGLERPDGGRVLIDGADVTGAAPAERDTAFVFQQYSLYPHYTVYENLAFPLRSPLRRRPESEVRRRVEEIAGLLRIGDKLANRATELSGGEMQRVSIGRALVRAPRVFLMDEPLSSLDAKLREEMRLELKRIQVDLGATILYVTHDQIEALTLADRIGVLRQGRLLQVSTPRGIYGAPDDLFVARQLGAPPINVLPVGALGLESPLPGARQVGVRPEDVDLAPAGEAAEGAARVLQVERFGAEDVVLLEAEGHRIRALAPPGLIAGPGQAARLTFAAEGLLFFDGDGKRLPVPSEAPARAAEDVEMSHAG